MDSVNDLKKTNEASTEVTLSDMKAEAVAEDQQQVESPVINISPRRKTHRHRTIDKNSTDTKNTVNPDNFSDKSSSPSAHLSIEENALKTLESAVLRKRKEYKQFLDHAYAADKINRERVEEGLETVSDELHYLPPTVDNSPIPEEDQVVPLNTKTEEEEKNETVDSKDEEKERDETKDTEVDVSKVVINSNPFEEESDAGDFEKQTITVPVMPDIEPAEEVTGSDFEIDQDDEEESYYGDDGDISDEESMAISLKSEKHLRSEILEKIIQRGKKMNTSQFVVSNKIIDGNAVLAKNKPVEKTAIWPLTCAGRPYKASALKGYEIAFLADLDKTEEAQLFGLTPDHLKIIFEHDANPYRPSTVEKWAQTIPFPDIENIFGALYMASLNGSNYIPMVCPRRACQYSYLSDNFEIEKLLNISDKFKERFDKIRSMPLTKENSQGYESVITPLNNQYAIGLRTPSIYNLVYEFGMLDREFMQRYQTIIGLFQYIDYIYLIDEASQQFQPIGWKVYEDDPERSFRSKISIYSKILKEFEEAEFTTMTGLISSMTDKLSDYLYGSFKIPGDKCPQCGANIEGTEVNFRSMLFMRRRLVELATTHSKN